MKLVKVPRFEDPRSRDLLQTRCVADTIFGIPNESVISASPLEANSRSGLSGGGSAAGIICFSKSDSERYAIQHRPINSLARLGKSFAVFLYSGLEGGCIREISTAM